MKSLIIALILLGTSFIVKAQIENPVQWSYAAKKVNAKEAILYLKADIDARWHLYSQNVKPGGPVKTSITFTPSKSYTKLGATAEPKPITKFEKVFGMNVSYFESGVIFQQRVKLNGKLPISVKGKVEYMVCNDEQCLPPSEVEFSVVVK